MIPVQDSFGELIIPLGMNMGNVITDFLNDSGLVLVPFAWGLINSFSSARVQGEDEGPTAVMGVKFLEAQFFCMLLVIVIGFLPMNDNQTQSISYKHYQCANDYKSDGLSKLVSDESIISNANGTIYDLTSANPSLAIGLANTLSVGTSETLSSQAICELNSSAITADAQLQLLKIEDDNIVTNLKTFNQQCYEPAMGRIANGVKNGTTSLSYPYSISDNRFFGTNMLAAYKGIDSAEGLSPLTMRISDDLWAGTAAAGYIPEDYKAGSYATSNTSYLLIPCTDAANDLKDIVEDYVDDKYADEISNVYKSRSQYPAKNINTGASETVSQTDVENELIHTAFINSVTEKAALADATQKDKSTLQKVKGWMLGLYKDKDENAEAIMSKLGMIISNASKANERNNLYGVLPLYISCATAVVIMIYPLLVMLSGFNIKIMFNTCFILFYLSMCHYILNLCYGISNVLWMLADSYYSLVWSIQQGKQAIHYVALSIPFIGIGIWTIVCMMAGLKLPPFITAFLTVMSTQSARAGNAIVQQVLTRGASKFIGKGK